MEGFWIIRFKDVINLLEGIGPESSGVAHPAHIDKLTGFGVLGTIGGLLEHAFGKNAKGRR